MAGNKRMELEQRRKTVLPTSDIFARYLLSNRKYVHLTKSFINSVLEDSSRPLIERVAIRFPFTLAESYRSKETILDVEAYDQNGRIFDIEIQDTVSKAFFMRLSYYRAGLFHGQLKTTGRYEQLNPCIMIALLNTYIYTDLRKPHHFSATVDDKERSRA